MNEDINENVYVPTALTHTVEEVVDITSTFDEEVIDAVMTANEESVSTETV